MDPGCSSRPTAARAGAMRWRAPNRLPPGPQREPNGMPECRSALRARSSASELLSAALDLDPGVGRRRPHPMRPVDRGSPGDRAASYTTALGPGELRQTVVATEPVRDRSCVAPVREPREAPVMSSTARPARTALRPQPTASRGGLVRTPAVAAVPRGTSERDFAVLRARALEVRSFERSPHPAEACLGMGI
jgi:hypothetical protein